LRPTDSINHLQSDFIAELDTFRDATAFKTPLTDDTLQAKYEFLLPNFTPILTTGQRNAAYPGRS
jgi:hypothetical protein